MRNRELSYAFLFCILSGFIYSSCTTNKTQSAEPKTEKVETKAVVLIGTAYNAKGGAVLETPDKHVYYIENLNKWEEKYYNKKVEVKGDLETMQYLPVATTNEKGEISQGVEGDTGQEVIRNATYRLVE